MGFRDGTEHSRNQFEYECPAVGTSDVNYGLLQLAVLLPVAEWQQTYCSSVHRTSLNLSDDAFDCGEIQLTSLSENTVGPSGVFPVE